MSQVVASFAPHAAARSYNRRQRTLHVTLTASLPLFLVATVLRRLNPFGARPARTTILAEARSCAATTVPFIFMG